MATNVGTLLILIGAETKGLLSGVLTARTALGGLEKASYNVASSVNRLATAGVAAGVALAGYLVNQSNETIDAQSKLAYRINSTVEAVQTLTHAADLAGISTEALTKSAGILNQRLGQAAREGAGPVYEQLRRLNLTAEQLINLPVDERLAVIGDRFRDLGYNTAQQADALRQLGIRSQEVINLMEGGGDAIRSARKDVIAFGVAVSDIDAAKVEAANDEWTRARLLLTGIANTFVTEISGAFRYLAEQFVEAGRESGGFKEQIKTVVDYIVIGFLRARQAIYELRISWINFKEALEVGPNLSGDSWWNKIIPPMYRQEMKEQRAEYQKLRDEVEKPPSIEETLRILEERKKAYTKEAEDVVETRRKANANQKTQIDNLTTEQRQAYEQRFLALQKSLANEAEALDIARREELAKIDEFESKRIKSKSERDALRAAVEAKFAEEKRNLVFSTLEQDILKEDELLSKKYEGQLAKIQEFQDAHTITEQRAGELRMQYARKFSDDMMLLHARQWSGLASIVDTAMGSISNIIGKEGGAAFEVLKGISVATALVKGYEAVVSAMAYGNSVGGPPVGFAFGAIAAAGVAAQVAALIATKPGSSGSSAAAAPSAGGASASAAAAGASGPQQTLYISPIKDGMYSGESVRRLARELVQFQDDGGKVVMGNV